MAQPAALSLDPALGAHVVLIAASDGNVADVVDGMTKLHQPVIQPSIAHRTRPHVHAAALLSQVHRRANNVHLARVQVDLHRSLQSLAH